MPGAPSSFLFLKTGSFIFLLSSGGVATESEGTAGQTALLLTGQQVIQAGPQEPRSLQDGLFFTYGKISQALVRHDFVLALKS